MTYQIIQDVKKTNGGDPIFTARAAISPLFMVFTWQQGVHPLYAFFINKVRDSLAAVNEKEYIGIATDKFKQYFNGAISISDLQEDYRILENNAQKLYEEVSDVNLSDLSDDDLQKYMYRLNELCLELVQKTIYIENVDYEIMLGVVGPEHKARLDAIWERATESAFVSFENRRLKRLLDLISANPKNLVRKAEFIFTDYFWVKDSAEISNELNTIKDNFSDKTKQFEKAEDMAIQKKAEHDAWLLTLDEQSRKIAEYAQLVMHMRDLRKDPIAQIQTMFAEVGTAMLEKAGVGVEHAPYVLLYEYMRGVSHLTNIKKDIELRSQGCMYLAYPDLSYKTENCDFEVALKEFDEVVHPSGFSKTDDLKGQVACKGKVQGVVRVVFDPHDDKGFKEGDILVTSMTRPEFLPIMKKAGAVVTNEGGITCHAAIVSRELQIPCIIGTKFATKVLKDGDFVEVDAEKGVVKIIK